MPAALTPVVFGDGLFRPLIVAHALAAIVLAGAQGHLLVLAWGRLKGRDVPSARLLRHLHSVAGAFAAAFVLGLLAYPHYRYHVRGLVLDRDFPWASNLFDLKEQLAALAVPVLIAAYFVERSAQAPRVVAALLVGLGVLVFFVLVSGLLVTAVRGA